MIYIAIRILIAEKWGLYEKKFSKDKDRLRKTCMVSKNWGVFSGVKVNSGVLFYYKIDCKTFFVLLTNNILIFI
ncbi:hypothetical protein [Liquorilactobacillus uvarum]|uniref:hypothetical protein n=1 Tax=Liquorilactobacillus uvarum TaxID=303240 RepID=UPI00288A091B|nr:hypothetical protein [Liquorilactobacillus uvarum]